MLTWKTLRGKNHGSPQTPNYHYVKEYNREHRGNDLLLTIFAWRRLQQRHGLYRSLSLSLSLCTIVTPMILYEDHNNNYIYITLFALGHIYINMTLGLFTDIAPMGSQKHIYIYVPSSGERFSLGLQHPVLTGSSLPGTRHPVLTGPASSSSHRAFNIRFSPGLPCWVHVSHPEGPRS